MVRSYHRCRRSTSVACLLACVPNLFIGRSLPLWLETKRGHRVGLDLDSHSSLDEHSQICYVHRVIPPQVGRPDELGPWSISLLWGDIGAPDCSDAISPLFEECVTHLDLPLRSKILRDGHVAIVIRQSHPTYHVAGNRA